jgi:hypothetical protein
MVWILIYAGLFALILGLASIAASPTAGWLLIVGGVIGAAAGCVLIWIRSRLGQPGKQKGSS